MLVRNLLNWWKLARKSSFICGMHSQTTPWAPNHPILNPRAGWPPLGPYSAVAWHDCWQIRWEPHKLCASALPWPESRHERGHPHSGYNHGENAQSGGGGQSPHGRCLVRGQKTIRSLGRRSWAGTAGSSGRDRFPAEEEESTGTYGDSAPKCGSAPVCGGHGITGGICQEASLNAPDPVRFGTEAVWRRFPCAAVVEGLGIPRPGSGMGRASPGKHMIWPRARPQARNGGNLTFRQVSGERSRGYAKCWTIIGPRPLSCVPKNICVSNTSEIRLSMIPRPQVICFRGIKYHWQRWHLADRMAWQAGFAETHTLHSRVLWVVWHSATLCRHQKSDRVGN